jgi:hypothetical protein
VYCLPHLFINDEMPIEYAEFLHVLLYVFHMNLKSPKIR